MSCVSVGRGSSGGRDSSMVGSGSVGSSSAVVGCGSLAVSVGSADDSSMNVETVVSVITVEVVWEGAQKYPSAESSGHL